MNLKKLPYFVKRALSNIKRNPLVNFVTISTISIAMLIFSTFIMITYNLSNIVSKFEDEVQVIAYLKDEYIPRVNDIKDTILKMEGVEKVGFISKESALEKFRSSLGSNDKFLDDIRDNPLPASFEIRLKKGFKNKAKLKEINDSLIALNVFDDTVYGQEWIENFNNFLNLIKMVGMAVASGFLLAAVFIISNTIKLTMYARRDEIEILRLVGATDDFIRGPFFIEGIIQGFLGAVISIILLYIIYLIFLAKIQVLSFMGINPKDMPFLPIGRLFLITIFSTLLGMFGSFLSLGDFVDDR